jgi:methanogenic corrinoid protein MtbC1
MAALPTLPDTVPALIDPSQPFADVANSYLRSLLTLDRAGAVEHVLNHFESGLTIQQLFDHVITPVQREVGRLWQQNQITVVQEHFCTAATEMLIARLRRKHLGVLRGVSALAICAEGEEHCLGLKMLSDLLEADGWNVYYAGSKPPATEVLKHLASNKTDLVALSVATALNLSSMRRLIREIKALPPEQTPRVLVGGMALTGDQKLWKKIGADAFAASVGEGLEQANRLVRR